MSTPAPLSNQDLDFFFESHHHELADQLNAVGQAFLNEESQAHDLEYSARVARALGAQHNL